MQPRQMRETSRPVRPSFTYSIIQSPTDHRPKGTELAHTLRKIFCNKKALITLPPRRDDPTMRFRPVGEIAFAAGFKDLSHFSRAYRARYGCAPGDARRAAVAAR